MKLIILLLLDKAVYLRKESKVKFMKNAKQNKVVKKTIRNYEPNNAWKYQQEKESNIGMSHLEQKEEEGKQYEQMNYEQLKKYVDCLMLSEQEMQKSR